MKVVYRYSLLFEPKVQAPGFDLGLAGMTWKFQLAIQYLVSLDGPLTVAGNFRYLGSLISSSVSLDAEIDAPTGRAATMMARFNSRIWENKNLTLHIPIWKSTRLMFLAPSSVVVRPRLHVPDKGQNYMSTIMTYKSIRLYKASHGRTRSPIVRSLRRQSLYHNLCDAWWTPLALSWPYVHCMAASPRTCCVDSWNVVHVL